MVSFDCRASVSDAVFFDFVESVHRGNNAFVNRAFHGRGSPFDSRFYQRFFLLEKVTQDIVARSLGRSRPNPNPQPGHVFGAELNNHRLQTVVPAGTPTLADP